MSERSAMPLYCAMFSQHICDTETRFFFLYKPVKMPGKPNAQKTYGNSILYEACRFHDVHQVLFGPQFLIQVGSLLSRNTVVFSFHAGGASTLQSETMLGLEYGMLATLLATPLHHGQLTNHLSPRASTHMSNFLNRAIVSTMVI